MILLIHLSRHSFGDIVDGFEQCVTIVADIVGFGMAGRGKFVQIKPKMSHSPSD